MSDIRCKMRLLSSVTFIAFFCYYLRSYSFLLPYSSVLTRILSVSQKMFAQEMIYHQETMPFSTIHSKSSSVLKCVNHRRWYVSLRPCCWCLLSMMYATYACSKEDGGVQSAVMAFWRKEKSEQRASGGTNRNASRRTKRYQSTNHERPRLIPRRWDPQQQYARWRIDAWIILSKWQQ